MPQLPSYVIRTQDELLRERRFLFHLKADYATASTAVWRIGSAEDLESTCADLAPRAPMDGDQEYVVQEPVSTAEPWLLCMATGR